jgi:hypothetical protein
MTENAMFKQLALPNLGASPSEEEKYLQLTLIPVVLAIKTALETIIE